MNGEHWREYFDSKYLGNWDLPRDRDCVVTISKVEKGTVEGQKGKKDQKAIVHFRGKEKPLAANRTNCKTIAAMHGPNPREWVGKQIAMYVAQNIDSPLGPVDAIRIRPRIPTATTGERRGTPPGQRPPAALNEAPVRDAEWTPEEPPMGALETDDEQP